MATKTPTKSKAPAKPRVHRIEKEIVTEGRYLTSDDDGKMSYKNLTREDIEGMKTTFDHMKSKGLSVPAPWKHDFGITAFTKIKEGSKGVLDDSTQNGGFWTEMTTRENEEGKLVAVGIIEAPGDPEDPNTPAGKIGTTVKETSIYLRKKHPLTDDSGEVLENVPMHIALVTHAIEPNQKNFELKDGDYAIAMSQLVLDDAPASDFAELSRLLSKVAKIFLPNSTTMETLVGNLIIALEQKNLLSEEDSSSSPSNTFVMEPLVMSKLSKEQVDALVKANAVNPATEKPFTADELQALGADAPKKEETPTSTTKADLMMSHMQAELQNDRRGNFRSRINTLIENGIVAQDVADKQLFPKADGYLLKFGESGVETPELETILMSLESIPKPAKSELEGLLSDAYQDSYKDPGEVDEEGMDKMAQSMLNEIF